MPRKNYFSFLSHHIYISAFLLLAGCNDTEEGRGIPKSVFRIKLQDESLVNANAAGVTQKIYVVDKFELKGQLIYDSRRAEGERVVDKKTFDQCSISWGLRIKDTPKIYHWDEDQVEENDNKAQLNLPDIPPPGMSVINEDTKLEVAAELTLPDRSKLENDQNDENLLPPTTVSKMIAETVEGGIAGDAVSEEKEDFQTGGGKSTSETTEEDTSSTETKETVAAKTAVTTTVSEAVTEEQEETETGGSKSTSETTEEAEIQAANKKISDEAEHPAVKITVLKKAAFALWTKPQEADIEFDNSQTDPDLKFEFIRASSINFWGKVKIRYRISYAVEGVTPKECSQSVTHSPTYNKAKKEEQDLKKQYKDCLSEVFTGQDKVLALKESSQAASEGTVYALTFSNISTKRANKVGRIVLPCTLWKSRANGMFKKVRDLQDCFSIGPDPESRSMGTKVQLALNIKKRDEIEELKSFFNNETYQWVKTESGVDFISLKDKKSSSAVTVPRQRRVNKKDLLGKKFCLNELTYKSENYRYLEFQNFNSFWEFCYEDRIPGFHLWSVKSQEIKWELKRNDGKDKIHAWCKNGSPVINKWIKSTGEVIPFVYSGQNYWIKKDKQFELEAYISWSETNQGQLYLTPEYKPKRWGDKNSFWFMQVKQRLDKWDGKSDLNQSVIGREVHLVPQD